jgi:hypothetical protein
MLIKFTYKQGTSLWFGSELLDDQGDPTSGLGVDVTSVAQHNKTGETKALVLVWVDRPAGRFEFWASGDGTCTGWELGTWLCDVQCSRPASAPNGYPLVLASESVQLFVKDRP